MGESEGGGDKSGDKRWYDEDQMTEHHDLHVLLYVPSEWLADIFRKGPQGIELLFSNWSLDSAMQDTTPRSHRRILGMALIPVTCV